MRFRSFTAIAAASLTGVVAAPSASAATSVALRVTDMATSPLFKVICVDGTPFESKAPTPFWGVTVDPGVHHVTVYDAKQHTCGTEGPVVLDTDFTVGEAPYQTLVLWGAAPDLQISVLVDDLTCSAAGTARITYRPTAATGNVRTTLGYGDFVPVVEDVAVGTQKSTVVLDGAHAAWKAVDADDGSLEVEGIPFLLPIEAGTTTFVYTYGGSGEAQMLAQGGIGCYGPVPESLLPPTTPAAQPVAVTPLFTG